MPVSFRKITPATRISSVAIFTSLSFAVMATVWSLYLNTFLHNAAYVGYVSAFITTLSVIMHIVLTPVLGKYSEYKLSVYSIIGLVFAYFVLWKSSSLWILLVGASIYVIFKVLHRLSHGILVCESVKKKELGQAEGIYVTFRNVGYIFGPLIGGFVADRLGIPFVFVVCITAAVIGLLMFKTIKIPRLFHSHQEFNIISNCKKFFSKKRMRLCYSIGGGFQLHWTLIYIFLPLYIVSNGWPIYAVGVFLFLVSVPCAIMEYPIGRYVDRTSHRTVIIMGYSILGAMSILAAFSGDIFWTLSFFVGASVGAALLEGTCESYFFRIVPRNQEEPAYGTYKTKDDLFGTIGKLVAATTLLWFSFNALFLVLGVVMLLYAWLSLKIKV